MQLMNQITINLHGIVEQIVTVNSYDTPSNLVKKLNIVEDSEFFFVYKGRILAPALSFILQGVGENKQCSDELYVVQRKTNKLQSYNSNSYSSNFHHSIKQTEDEFKKKFMEHYGNRFRVTDTVFEQMFYATNPKTTLEFARLTDIFKMKVESNAAAFRRICENYDADNNNNNNSLPTANRGQQQTVSYPTVLPQKAISPSTEFMPVFFA